MRNITVYTILIISACCLIFGRIIYSSIQQGSDHHYFKDHFEYYNAKKYDICILKDSSNRFQYFMVVGRTTDHRLCVRYGHETMDIKVKELDKIIFSSDGSQLNFSEKWVSDMYENSSGWDKALTVLTQTEIETLKETNTIYYYSPPLIVGEIPDYSIIIPLNIIILIVSYLLIYLVNIANQRYTPKRNYIAKISITALSTFMAFFYMFHWLDKLFFILFIKNILSFFCLYYLLNFLNSKLQGMSFSKKEWIKMVVIIVFGLVMEYVGGHTCNYLYYDLLKVEDPPIYRFDGNSFVMGWFAGWVYFSLANFLSNLTLYVIALRKNEKLYHNQKNVQSLKTAALATIQSRINPHFLYNSLNSIATLTRSEPKKSAQMALELAKFYDECNNEHRTLVSTIGVELSMLQSYLKIEQIRFGDRLKLVLPENKDVFDLEIPTFIIQPLVENAIKYGYDAERDEIDIRITVKKNQHNLTIKVYDSGPPFQTEMQMGYGLKSITQKLKVMYPDKYSLSFSNFPEKCAEIELEIDYTKIY